MPSTALLTNFRRADFLHGAFSADRDFKRPVLATSEDRLAAPERTRSDAASVTELRGHVCAVGVYRVWKSGKGSDDDTLNALCSLLFKRYDNDAYSAEYAAVTFSAKSAAKRWDLGPEYSAANLAAMANSAARTKQWPLPTLDKPMAWKALYCEATAALRDALGLDGLYRPIALYVNCETGLAIRAVTVKGEIGAPVPGIMRLEGEITLDPKQVEAAAVQKGCDGITVAHARLHALRCSTRPCVKTAAACSVEIITKTGTFSGDPLDGDLGHRSDEPPAKKIRTGEGSTGPLGGSPTDRRACFSVSERVLRLPTLPGRPVRVKSLVPIGFDCLVTAPADYSTIAAMAVFSRWYSALHADAGTAGDHCAIAPIFAYIGPEVFPKGEDRDYAFWPGFPGWQVLKAPMADKSAVREATRIYALTDGLWPMAGPRALHALCAYRGGGSSDLRSEESEKTMASVRAGGRTLAELAEQWPAGRIRCGFPACQAIHDADLAKMDFCAFLPTLCLALRPDRRLEDAVRTRIARRDPWLKRPLVEFCGMLKRTDAPLYRAAMLVANGVADAVENAAAAAGFAICTYVKDGFWGAFACPPENAEDRRATLKTRVETLRAECERAANAFVTQHAGLRFPPGISLRLRTEGTYTDAVSWNAGCYYLYDRAGGSEEFVGFPAGTAFGGEAKTEITSVLRRFFESDNTAEDLIADSEAACVRLVERAFEKRSDVDFWTTSHAGPDVCGPEELAARAGLLANSRLADRAAVNGDCVKAVTATGRIVSVPCSAFPRPMVLPAVACEEIAAPVFHAIIRLVDALAESATPGMVEAEFDGQEDRADGEDDAPPVAPPTVKFALDDYSFLFLKHR